jgi:uncharacterized membrane protein
MLLSAVLLWALNITVTKYMFEHGWLPLAYGTIRYFVAISIFWAYTWWRERSFRIARADWPYVGIAASMIFVNQVCFVYSLEFAHAATVSLLFASCPMFVGLISIVILRTDLRGPFWIGAGLTFAGVALIAGRRRGRARLRLEGGPARDRARSHLGGLHDRDRTADAALLPVPHQRRRARARLGTARAGEHPADRPPGLSPSPGRSGSASSTRSSGRSSSRTSSGSRPSTGSAPRERRSSTTCSRSSACSSRS